MQVKVLAGASYAAILLSSICANAAGDTSTMPENTVAVSMTGAAIGDQDVQPSAKACAAVADAKFEQWNQRRFMIRQTETFADGRRKVVEAIFTPDLAYARENGGQWSSMNLVRAQRSVPSADYIVRRMGIQSCSRGGAADANANRPVSMYSYDYLPDANAGEVTGRMWIDDSSRLPVRQELAQSVSSQQNLPISMEASYTYGDAVIVPADAVRSDERRRWNEQQLFLGNVASTSGSERGGTSFPGRHH